MKLTEQQWNPTRMLLCDGSEGGVQHAAPVPRVQGEGVSSSDLRCEECGSPMILVDVLTIDRTPTVLSLAYDRDPPLYTIAKLHPLPMLTGD